MEIPDYLREYPCADYFDSDLASTGYWDEEGQQWLIVPAVEIEGLRAVYDAPVDFLTVGSPGVDGIAWGYRKGRNGFWVYYPIDDEFQYLAPSVQDFLKRWLVGVIGI